MYKYVNNPTKQQIYDQQRKKQARLDCINHYSNGTNQCAMCGEHRIEFLVLDHINAEPKKFAESIGIKSIGGGSLYIALRKRNYPKGIQILCQSCNQVKRSHITSKGSRQTDRLHIIVESKKCAKCKQIKTADSFSIDKSKKDGLKSYCIDCSNLYSKLRDLRRKQKLINRLGSKCSCCGESRLEVLSIEHSNNDGNKHRKYLTDKYNLSRINTGGTPFIHYYLKELENGNEWPGIEVHCHNCNHSKASYGYCPHDREKGIL